MANTAYQVTEADIESVLRSNILTVHHTNGEPFNKMASVLIGQLDLDQVDQAAHHGASQDEKADSAKTEIARQLRSIGVLKYERALG
ncbi:hypothetical protein LPN04_31220 [Rugamonas sp. A1-17]|nr:hypothetical protein [Rugamonas sp. A1-17]